MHNLDAENWQIISRILRRYKAEIKQKQIGTDSELGNAEKLVGCKSKRLERRDASTYRYMGEI